MSIFSADIECRCLVPIFSVDIQCRYLVLIFSADIWCRCLLSMFSVDIDADIDAHTNEPNILVIPTNLIGRGGSAEQPQFLSCHSL
jgi:hypothetical protein